MSQRRDEAADRVAPSEADRTTSTAELAGVLFVLVVSNVVVNEYLPAALYVPWNLTVAAAIVAMALRVVSTDELGLNRWRRGLRWGGILFAATLAILLIGAAIPATRRLFDDNRVDGGVPTLLYQTVLRIPLGTALLEELAFRSVLPALIAVRVGVLRGSIYASALFGLWHVLPSLGLSRRNPATVDAFGGGVSGQLVAVLLAVIGTWLAGMAWCWLRYRSSSVITTWLAHVATNSLSFAVAWSLRRW